HASWKAAVLRVSRRCGRPPALPWPAWKSGFGGDFGARVSRTAYRVAARPRGASRDDRRRSYRAGRGERTASALHAGGARYHPFAAAGNAVQESRQRPNHSVATRRLPARRCRRFASPAGGHRRRCLEVGYLTPSRRDVLAKSPAHQNFTMVQWEWRMVTRALGRTRPGYDPRAFANEQADAEREARGR